MTQQHELDPPITLATLFNVIRGSDCEGPLRQHGITPEILDRLLADGQVQAVLHGQPGQIAEFLEVHGQSDGYAVRGLSDDWRIDAGIIPTQPESAARGREAQAQQLAVDALRNYGADVTCGACMEIAFTGVTTNQHSCKDRDSATEPDLRALVERWKAEAQRRRNTDHVAERSEHREQFSGGKVDGLEACAAELSALLARCPVPAGNHTALPVNCWHSLSDLPNEPPRCNEQPPVDWSLLHPAIRHIEILWWDGNGSRYARLHRPLPAAPVPDDPKGK